MLKLFLIALLLPSFAYAEEWTSADIKREVAYQSIAVVDWLQTRNIARDPCYYEQNKILGSHPSIARVNQYFALTGIAHYFVSKALPEKYRIPFQYISIGVEVGAVGHNFSIGINARF